MTLLKDVTKIIKEFESDLLEKDFFLKKLTSLDLFAFEESLYDYITELYNNLSMVILKDYTESDNFLEQAKYFSQAKGLGKLEKRATKIKIRTGSEIEVNNYYLRNAPSFYKGVRHTFHAMFKTIEKSSPMYYSAVSMTSVICPSFDVASQILNLQNVKTDKNNVRKISIKVGEKCLSNRVGIQFKKGETLSGKNVVVSIDGGRSRIRENREELNSKGTHNLFDTNWREPKLFIIHIIDPKTGKQSKEEIPIYDCTFGTEEIFELLSKYLKKLDIQKASKVQFIADGAIWIWDRAKQMLLDIGVKEQNIIETLDYYHGSEHLSELVKSLPKKISEKQRKEVYIGLKDLLWNGKINEIITTIEGLIKRKNKTIKREFNYFKKHEKRCNYAFFKEIKMLCGSGIIESGIRRIINLRFKSPSSFWYKKNLEALIFLRATLLSKRWNYMILNLSKI